MKYKLSDFYTGRKCTCKIWGDFVTDAKISVDEDGSIYICQNIKDGDNAEDKLGYKYSWAIFYPVDEVLSEREFRSWGVTNLRLLGKDKAPKAKNKVKVKSEKYVISSTVFDTLKEAEEKISEWQKDGSLDENAKVYKVEEVWKPELRLIKE